MTSLRVEIWSDIACPWCWVGKRQLEAAIEQFPHPVEVTWRAFELDPSAPRSPQTDGPPDMVKRLADKYGVGRPQAQQMIDRMTGVGAEHGLPFRFDRMQPSNTFDAHRLLHWAGAQGRGSAMKERLFDAYMHQGQAIADHEVLVDLAEREGLSAERAQALLSSDEHARDVRADEARAAELGVSGVPFFVIGERYAVSGAQPSALLRQAMQRAWDEGHTTASAPAPEASPSGEACGPDGCALPSPG